MDGSAGSPAGPSVHPVMSHRTVARSPLSLSLRLVPWLLLAAAVGAGCEFLVPPDPGSPGLSSFPVPSAAPPRFSPTIEVPPPR